MKAKNKTIQNNASVESFLNGVVHPKRKEDAFYIFHMMNELLPEKPTMWGPAIVGYGNYHYRYASGREGDFFKTGFSPRKQNLTIYIMPGFERFDELMSQLGKYKTGKSCLYIKKLEDIDLNILKELILESYRYMTQKYG